MKGKIVTDYLTCVIFQVIHLANWFGRWAYFFYLRVKIKLFCAREGAYSLPITKRENHWCCLGSQESLVQPACPKLFQVKLSAQGQVQ